METHQLHRDVGQLLQRLTHGAVAVQIAQQVLPDRNILRAAEGAHGSDGFLREKGGQLHILEDVSGDPPAGGFFGKQETGIAHRPLPSDQLVE